MDGEPSVGPLTPTTLRQDGDGGLTTLRVSARGPRRSMPRRPPEPRVRRRHYRGRVGWREIVVVGDRTRIAGDVTADSVTARATDFPDADENPDTSTVVFDFAASDVGQQNSAKTEPHEDDDTAAIHSPA